MLDNNSCSNYNTSMGKKQEKLKWTKDKPTKEGYYWLKEDKTESEIVLIQELFDGLWIWIQRDEDVYALPEDAEWAGPIEEPE